MHTNGLSTLIGIWLLAGTGLLLTSSLAAFTPLLGWGPLLWLVISPLVMLCIREPQLPLRLLAHMWPIRASARHMQAVRKTVH